MITKELMLTPLNMGYNAALNTQAGFVTFDVTKFNAATDRSVLIYSATQSKFKLKTGTLQPYLEPVFFGIKNNDFFEIEFEAIGDNVVVDFQLGDISEAYASTTIRTSNRHTVKVKSSYYKKYYATVNMGNISNGAIGVFFNIRNLTTGTEVLLRNIKFKIHTNNPYFDLNHRYLKFERNSNFVKSITKYSQSTSLDYSHITTSYGNGQISVANNKLTIASVSVGFKGIVTKIPTPKYRTPLIVTLKYNTSVLAKIDIIGFRNGVQETLSTTSLIATTAETNGLFVINIADVTNIDDIVLQIGIAGSGTMTISDCLINICDSSDNIINHLNIVNALI